MAKLTVELEWDDKHGAHWMNIDNLEICLYTEEHTRRDLLTITKAVGADGEQHSAVEEARCHSEEKVDDNLDAHPGFY